jgi:transposase
MPVQLRGPPLPALLDRINAATAMQTRLDARIEVLIEPYHRRIELLATIPSLSQPPHR